MPNNFRIAHINVRSLAPHFAKDLICYHEIDVLAFSETWLRERDDTAMYNIQNYSLLRFDKTSGSRGGGGGSTLYKQLAALLTD